MPLFNSDPNDLNPQPSLAAKLIDTILKTEMKTRLALSLCVAWACVTFGLLNFVFYRDQTAGGVFSALALACWISGFKLFGSLSFSEAPHRQDQLGWERQSGEAIGAALALGPGYHLTRSFWNPDRWDAAEWIQSLSEGEHRAGLALSILLMLAAWWAFNRAGQWIASWLGVPPGLAAMALGAATLAALWRRFLFFDF